MPSAKVTDLFSHTEAPFLLPEILKVGDFMQRCSNWRISLYHGFSTEGYIRWNKDIVVLKFEGHKRSYASNYNSEDLMTAPAETLTLQTHFPERPSQVSEAKLRLPQYLWVLMPLVLAIESHVSGFSEDCDLKSLEKRITIGEPLTHPMSARKPAATRPSIQHRMTHNIHHPPPTELEKARELVIESLGLTKKIGVMVVGVSDGRGEGFVEFDSFAEAKKVFPDLDVEKSGKRFGWSTLHATKEGKPRLRFDTHESCEALSR